MSIKRKMMKILGDGAVGDTNKNGPWEITWLLTSSNDNLFQVGRGIRLIKLFLYSFFLKFFVEV